VYAYAKPKDLFVANLNLDFHHHGENLKLKFQRHEIKRKYKSFFTNTILLSAYDNMNGFSKNGRNKTSEASIIIYMDFAMSKVALTQLIGTKNN